MSTYALLAIVYAALSSLLSVAGAPYLLSTMCNGLAGWNAGRMMQKD